MISDRDLSESNSVSSDLHTSTELSAAVTMGPISEFAFDASSDLHA